MKTLMKDFKLKLNWHQEPSISIPNSLEYDSTMIW